MSSVEPKNAAYARFGAIAEPPAQHPDRLIDGLHIDLLREGRGAGILYLELANLLRLAVTIAPSQSVLTWVIGLLSTSGLNPIAGCPRHVHVTLYLPLAELSLLVIECRQGRLLCAVPRTSMV